MLAHDVGRHSDRAARLRRQTAQLVVCALQRGRAPKRDLARAFARHGPGLALSAALRALETKGWLPGPLHGDRLRLRD